MKHRFPLAVLLALLLLLTGCGRQTPEAQPAPAEDEVTLESLCGEDYQSYLIDTITMQMENRMDKTPDVVYYPIRDKAPLTDYVAIDETTSFRVEDDGVIVILFPAGTVTDASHGEQSFRIPKP